MSARETIRVELAGRSYDALIEPGILNRLESAAEPYLLSYSNGRAVPIVADANTHRLYREAIEAALNRGGYSCEWFVVEPGETAKSWAVLERLTDWLLSLGITRSDHVIAFGGGVVGDLTGFACAILKRGCGFIQVPTTLLAQVDSSVGGKTAINTGAGKNLIGAFHQPALVVIDPLVLGTLPDREMGAGLAEVIKYGLLGNTAFFEWLEDNAGAVLAREEAALGHAIATSIREKARIVAEDERETSGVRALLNLGHTFGHALEAETGFSERLLHGEAVAMGMVLAARYSMRRGDLSESHVGRVAKLVGSNALPASLSELGLDCTGEDLVEHMRHDKKMEGDTLPFLLLNAIGEAYLARNVALDDIAKFLNSELASG